MFFGKLLTGIREELNKTPNRQMQSLQMTYKEVSNEISALLGWACPTIETDRLKMIIKCEKCKHYKKFKKKSDPKRAVRLCEIDKSARRPDFYCADGEEL